MYQCAHCVVCIVHLNVCVWSPLATYFSALSPWENRQQKKHSQDKHCFDLILHDMCLHYSLSLQARGSFTAECLCRVFTSKMQSCSILTCLENVCFSLNILYADLSLWNIYIGKFLRRVLFGYIAYSVFVLFHATTANKARVTRPHLRPTGCAWGMGFATRHEECAE